MGLWVHNLCNAKQIFWNIHVINAGWKKVFFRIEHFSELIQWKWRGNPHVLNALAFRSSSGCRLCNCMQWTNEFDSIRKKVLAFITHERLFYYWSFDLTSYIVLVNPIFCAFTKNISVWNFTHVSISAHKHEHILNFVFSAWCTISYCLIFVAKFFPCF